MSKTGSGSLLVMPLLVLNMGAEMIYILEQRLAAQSVKNDKSKKVLCDVLRTMVSNSFITELFRPQEMYTSSSTRQIFNKLAHSSIMRINEQSMDKLYDLMTMGVKYQFLCCNMPQQLLQVTCNHLSAMSLIAKGTDVEALVDTCFSLLQQNYCNLALGEWILLKQQVASFFLGRKVKVSLFLQSNIQHMDGTLVLNNKGRVGFGTAVPGTILYFDKGGKVKRMAKFEGANCAAEESIGEDFFDSKDMNGINLYSKDMRAGIEHDTSAFWLSDSRVPPFIAELKAKCGSHTGNESHGGNLRVSSPQHLGQAGYTAEAKGGGEPGPPAEGYAGGFSPPKRRASAAEEMNVLASLMGLQVDDTAEEMKPIKMSFDIMWAGAGGEGKEDEGSVNTVMHDGVGRRSSLADRMGELDMDEEEEKAEAKDDGEEKGGEGSDDEDDLLDLLDSVK